jgi:hypothetical protein
MAQQTAMHSLWEWIDANYHEDNFNINYARDISLKLEKEQIMKSFISGGYDGLHFPKVREAFDRKYLEDKFFEYFKETYGEVH